KLLPEIVERRRYLAQRYHDQLADIPGLKLPTEPTRAKSNWQSYCVRLPDSCNQLQVMQVMLDAGIGTRRGIMCAHREPAYCHETWSCGSDRLTESEQAQDHAILLPLFHQMSKQEQDAVVNELKTVYQMQR
ncbi:DegT/DnrJ/EryC1/StrS family aminotransferase, partial [Dolichospermum sp. ST_con]|nr:DegT/DnrJ/EryC1/StrS family aminotransferase [Dolichospermum sp. ST_con]